VECGIDAFADSVRLLSRQRARGVAQDHTNEHVALARSNPEPLARALDGLVGSPELRKTLGQQAQAACRARYSWKACAAAYADLLMNAPNRREGRGGP